MNVGFIGLGRMGIGMAANLLKARAGANPIAEPWRPSHA